MATTQEDRLTALLTPVLADAGLDLEAVEVSRAGKRSVLRLSVDKDGGVDLDQVAEVTREVSRVLDETDVMSQQAYTLEVGSPGIDRPLTLERHWRRNHDRLVKVTLGDETTLIGRITEVSADAVTLDVDGQPTVVPLADVRKALVQIEFSRKE